LEEDLRDERNDCVQDQAYIVKLKARIKKLEDALRTHGRGGRMSDHAERSTLALLSGRTGSDG
jgi:hypothetical protein